MADQLEKQDLIKEQYKDSANFNARVELHRRFGTNPLSWHRWVFNQFELGTEATILELGCGPGWLWLANHDRIPSGWEITLTDASSGMVEAARQQLKFRPFHFEQVDAQELPFASASFDAVIANHMLYHLTDKPKAFREIRRVLKPTGKLYASTIGRKHMHELAELKAKLNIVGTLSETIDFTLEDGAEQLSSWFSRVEQRLYDDTLSVTEVEPVIAHIASDTELSEKQAGDLRQILSEEITAKGAFRITKPSGIFIARPS